MSARLATDPTLHVLAHMARILLAAGLLAGVLAGGDPARADDLPSPEAVTHLHAGQSAIKAGKLAEARDELRAALALAPRYGDAHALLGAVYTKAERWSDALACYEKALEIGPPRSAHHYGIGCCKRALSDLAGARVALTKARELGEKELSAALAEDEATRPKGSPPRPESSSYETATLVETEYQLACVARDEGDPVAEKAALDRGLELVPAHGKLLIELGAWRLRSGDAPGAVRALEKAQAGAPDDLSLLYDLGRALLQVPGREINGRAMLADYRERDDARRSKVAGERRRAQAQTFAARAELELREGRKPAARDLSAHALELDPANELAKKTAAAAGD